MLHRCPILSTCISVISQTRSLYKKSLFNLKVIFLGKCYILQVIDWGNNTITPTSIN